MNSPENLHKHLSLKMNRKGFGLKDSIKDDPTRDYHSPIIEEIKAAGFTKKYGPLTVHLAQEFGFCYGVDRAVELAYETRRRFADKKLYLTTEIIHNPLVNQNLLDMGIGFLSGPYQNAKLDDVRVEDVVLVPAFGTTLSLLGQLVDKKCELVDTICASVIVVWKRVEKYCKEGFTALVHGKNYHEETQATTSRVTAFKDGRYVVVFDEAEAQYVCDYIFNGGNKEEFLTKFKDSLSPGFDPDLHLGKIGLANQTTMLSSESLKIADMVKQTMIQKFGVEKLNDHFRSFDTICNATQDRQTAVEKLRVKKPDVIIVIGGYNSSNTSHLTKVATEIAPTYHIDRAECVISRDIIRHKPFGQEAEIETKNWLAAGDLSLGITAGASTPNHVMGQTLDKIISFFPY